MTIKWLTRQLMPATAGLIGAGVALAVSEIYAGVISGGPSLVVAVGALLIDLAPPPLKDFAIAAFGLNDKLALVIGIVVVSLLAGAGLGVVARWRWWTAPAGFGAFGLLGAVAGIHAPLLASVHAVLAAAVSGFAGLWTLNLLVRIADAEFRAPLTFGGERRFGRRGFIQAAGAFAAVGAAAAVGGRILLERSRILAASRDEVELPPAAETVAAPSPQATVDVPDIDPVVTPNEDFYRIDTALSVPLVDLETWKLKITGMVDRPYELTFNQLLDIPMVERYVTLACVSNSVGGDLIDNAKWLGVPLTDILDRAGVQAGASQIVGRSVDEFTVGFPTERAFDGRNAMVAVGMNDEPLPLEHGFPARLVVAGLYGFVSATKWLSEIELTTLDGFDAYWIPRGWSKQAPIKTQSRIDVPRWDAVLRPGPVVVAGVAWAQNRGISKVEVQVARGDWHEATLADAISADTWRQWVYMWDDATPGVHEIRVRATDSTGETQTAEVNPPAPDGATGYHARYMLVEES